MTEREEYLVRMALIYLKANLDDACDSFVLDEEGYNEESFISVHGEVGSTPTEAEIEQLMKVFL